MNDTEIVTEGSGNVFEDLGFDRPSEEQAKAHLVREIRTIIDSRKLTQTQAGKLIGLPQPDLSQLLRGRTRGYTVDRLLRLIMALDRDIEIRITKRPKSRLESRIAVTAA
jgi:predicted XRE-type DNA-binding protein